MSLVRKSRFILYMLCSTILLSTTFALAQEPQEGRLMRFPDIHGNKIVFVYGGDLWLASSSGGAATESRPIPDVNYSPNSRLTASGLLSPANSTATSTCM